MKSDLPVQPPIFNKPLPPWLKAIYLIALTSGLALMISGSCWMMEVGCAIVIGAQLVSGRFSRGNRFSTIFGCAFVLFALASSAWMFAQAYRAGNVWLRTSPQWWWICFIAFIWLLSVATELKKKPVR